MFINNKTVTGFNNSQIAYPVGPEKDSYNINSWFSQDINTLEIIVKHVLVKNWICTVKKPNVQYREGTKFSEDLFTGTYKECVDYLMNNVMNTQKEWVYNDKCVHIYPE